MKRDITITVIVLASFVLGYAAIERVFGKREPAHRHECSCVEVAP